MCSHLSFQETDPMGREVSAFDVSTTVFRMQLPRPVSS